MSLEPWIIEQLEEEERRRKRDEEAQRSRIELPQTAPLASDDSEKKPKSSGVEILPLSQGSGSAWSVHWDGTAKSRPSSSQQ